MIVKIVPNVEEIKRFSCTCAKALEKSSILSSNLGLTSKIACKESFAWKSCSDLSKK